MICFDTSPIIWAVRGEAVAGQEEMIARARNYIRYLDSLPKKQPNAKVMMFPAPALAEYLVGCKNKEQRDKELRIVEASFWVPALDISTACLAAEIEDTDAMRSLRKATDRNRNQLRVDAMVIAIAIFHKAEKIITHDVRHFKRLAEGRMEISPIPEVDPPQGTLEEFLPKPD
jgi:predicted nucleic acid-binding protein